jgi:hypothetical protein
VFGKDRCLKGKDTPHPGWRVDYGPGEITLNREGCLSSRVFAVLRSQKAIKRAYTSWWFNL